MIKLIQVSTVHKKASHAKKKALISIKRTNRKNLRTPIP